MRNEPTPSENPSRNAVLLPRRKLILGDVPGTAESGRGGG